MDDAAAASYGAHMARPRSTSVGFRIGWRTNKFWKRTLSSAARPCQGFSALGKQGVSDERNTLWEYYAHTIATVQPKMFVLENVPAF